MIKSFVTPPLMRKSLLKKVNLMFIFLVVALSISPESYANLNTTSQQQEKIKVSGKVVDKNGESIIGANIIEKGTTNGTVTDYDGNFSLQIAKNAILHVTYIGYYSQDININGRTEVEIVLVEDTKTLEEVVVVGYGTQSKKTLTGAISSIKSDDIVVSKSTNLVNKLQGKIPGLNIRINTEQPGIYDNAINIRGFGTPLFIIDGVERPGSDFQRLASEDIESITILKDASAAIYGLNAANGVVLITTKTGSNQKTKFQFSSNFGFSQPTNKVPLSNAYQYNLLRTEADLNYGNAPYMTKEDLDLWKAGGPGYESTDWYNETFKKYSNNQEYNLSAQGGSERVAFFVNGNVLQNNGMLKSGDINYQKINIRSNLSAQLTNNIKANINFNLYSDKRLDPSSGMHEIQRGVISILPSRTVYSNNNPNYYNRTQDGQAMNPVPLSYIDQFGYNESNNDGTQTSIELIYSVPFVKGLSLRGFTAYDKNAVLDKSLRKKFFLYDYDKDTDSYVPTAFNYPTSISQSNYNTSFFDFQFQINYENTIKEDHKIKTTLVHERKRNFRRWSSIRKYYEFYSNDQIDFADEKDSSTGGNQTDVRNLSYLGRFNYDYKGKYLFEFAGRYDGSYRYHPDIRWGFFPVVSVGWRISEENFMKGLDFVSNLKLRGSVGEIGLDAGSPFQYISAFSTSGGGWYEFSDGTTTKGIGSPAIVNEKLTWMESKLSNIGIDLGLFNEQLAFTADIYRRDRTGLPAYRNVTLPNTFGGSFPQENLNSDRIQGFDLSLTHQKKVNSDFSYYVSGNFNFNRQQNLYVEQAAPNSSWEKYRGKQVNRNTGIVWTYNAIGQFQNEEEILNAPVYMGNRGNEWVLPGDWVYEDLNNDGVIDGNDIKPMFFGQHVPLMNYGLTLAANYKGIDVSMLFQGSSLFSKRYSHAYATMFWQNANLPAYFNDRWHREDPYDRNSKWIPGEWPAMRVTQYADAARLYEESNAWRKDASYLRFKNLEVGYTFDQKMVNKIGVDGLRFYFNMNNLYTWTDKYLKYFDPEVATGNYSAGWVYPISRTINLGFNLTF